MSAHEWKPGDVAMVDGMPSFYTVGLNGMAHWVFRNGGSRLASSQAEVRPLVLLDPEDREQIARLLGVDGDQWPGHVSDMQAALREFADPKPPRPDEPQGLGAVVEDEDETLWVRTEHKKNIGGCVWVSSFSVALPDKAEQRAYVDIAAVRVLSEGYRA